VRGQNPYPFKELKKAFTGAPVLAHYDKERQVVLETNAL
jgi:hypothetical protein